MVNINTVVKIKEDNTNKVAGVVDSNMVEKDLVVDRDLVDMDLAAVKDQEADMDLAAEWALVDREEVWVLAAVWVQEVEDSILEEVAVNGVQVEEVAVVMLLLKRQFQTNLIFLQENKCKILLINRN